MLKKLSGNLHFDTFSTWEGSYYREVAQEQHISVATSSHVPPQKLDFFSTKILGCPNVMENTSRHWPGTPQPPVKWGLMWPGLCQLVFRDLCIQMTVTWHSTKEKWKLNWICLFYWVFKSLFTLNTVPKYLCVCSCFCFIVRPTARCVLTSVPT